MVIINVVVTVRHQVTVYNLQPHILDIFV